MPSVFVMRAATSALGTQQQAAQVAGNGSQLLTLPSNFAAGDVLIATATCTFGQTPDLSNDPRWITLATVTNGSLVTVVAYFQATAASVTLGDRQFYFINHSSNPISAVVSVYRGVNVPASSVTSTTGSAATQVTSGALTAGASGFAVHCVGWNFGLGSPTPVSSTEDGGTERGDVAYSNYVSSVLFDERVTAGSVPTRTTTASTSSTSRAVVSFVLTDA